MPGSGRGSGASTVPALTLADVIASPKSCPASLRNPGELPTTEVPSSLITPFSVPNVATRPGLNQLCVRSSTPVSSSSDNVLPEADT